MLYLQKKGFLLNEITPFRDFFYMAIVPFSVLWGGAVYAKKQKEKDNEKAKSEKLEEEKKAKSESLTLDSFRRIEEMIKDESKKREKSEEQTSKIMLEQSKMIKTEDANKKFVDAEIFNMYSSNIEGQLSDIKDDVKELIQCVKRIDK